MIFTVSNILSLSQKTNPYFVYPVIVQCANKKGWKIYSENSPKGEELFFCKTKKRAQQDEKNKKSFFKKEKPINKLLKILTSYKDNTHKTIELEIPGNSDLLSGLTTDRSGNLYVADSDTNSVYRLGFDGKTFILAGQERVKGYKNGKSLEANFDTPRGMQVGANGNLYLADTGNGKIRVIDQNFRVSTLAGGFKTIVDVSVAPNGDIIAVDREEHSVYRIESGGRCFRIAGNGSPGDVSGIGNAQFNVPEGVCVGPNGKVSISFIQQMEFYLKYFKNQKGF